MSEPNSIDALVSALRGRREVDEWVAAARARSITIVRHGAGSEERRTDDRTEARATVHRDLPAGRGTARVRVIGGAIGPALDDAIARAVFGVGPPWQMAPPAAPAQVETSDPALTADAAEQIATRAYAVARTPEMTRLAGGKVEVDDVAVEVARERVDLASSQGLHVQWNATEAHVVVTIRATGRTAIARARSRQLESLGVNAAIASAAEQLGARAAAVAPVPGAYPIVMRLDALAPCDGTLGVWAAFAAQADAALVRQGLSRYRPGHPIVEDATQVAEPITIVSDGALPFGLASVPVGDEAEPVRRFTLVERGVAREVAYTQREAALAGARPNGGVRNLVVDGGATPASSLAQGGPLIDVASFAWIEIDPRTAQLSAGIELAYLRGDHGATPITGGVIRGDAIAALARAVRSSETATRGAYQGPIAIRTPPLELATRA
ncbi:MAG TPA: metallopeptidase TldD-related protein [Kofleriaceae bacterium]|nr:metallopeptidase TldD-related protein [Kofleriaceae bacterium]